MQMDLILTEIQQFYQDLQHVHNKSQASTKVLKNL